MVPRGNTARALLALACSLPLFAACRQIAGIASEVEVTPGSAGASGSGGAAGASGSSAEGGSSGQGGGSGGGGASGQAGSGQAGQAGQAGQSGQAGAGGVVPPGNGVGWWSHQNESGCFSAGLPTAADRPSPSASQVSQTIYFAASRFHLGARRVDGTPDDTAWASFGLDLDGSCTNSSTCPGSSTSSCKSTTAAIPYDGEYCRDNTFGRMQTLSVSAPELSAKYHLGEDELNCDACVGNLTLVFKLSRYNGEQEDDDVRLDVYPSPGLESPLPFDCSSGGSPGKACWLASSPWLIDETSMPQPSGGPDLADAFIADDHAYVRGGYLVASLPDGSRLGGASVDGKRHIFPLRLFKGLVVARLKQAQDSTWEMNDAMLAGRSRKDTILKGFTEVGICESDSVFSIVSQYINANLDTLASGDLAPDTPCDAMSLATRFEARQATPGKLAKPAAAPPCPSPDGGAPDGG